MTKKKIFFCIEDKANEPEKEIEKIDDAYEFIMEDEHSDIDTCY